MGSKPFFGFNSLMFKGYASSVLPDRQIFQEKLLIWVLKSILILNVGKISKTFTVLLKNK